MKINHILEIPLIENLESNNVVSELGELLAKEKAKNSSYAIHYFGLRYGKFITDNNISIKSIIAKALEYDPSFGSTHYDVELSKGVGVYKLAKTDGYEKEFTDKGNIPQQGKQSEQKESLDFASLAPLILYGPPGTGKTYKMQHEYIDKFAKEDRFITTFHQSFSYEEFVEGLKPVLADKPDGDTSSDVKYKIEKGIFYKACERAAELAGFASLQDCISASERNEKMDEAIKEKKNSSSLH